MSDLPDIPTYRSHKQVRAARMVDVLDRIGLVVVLNSDGERHNVAVPAGFFARSVPAVGDYLVVYRDGYMSHCPAKEFEDGYALADAPQPVLMGPQNPTGWKLEELLSQLQTEVQAKCGKIERDTRPVARAVLRNNQQIIGLLAQAEALQRDSYDRLDAMAPNEGPLGTPRIGAGSEG